MSELAWEHRPRRTLLRTTSLCLVLQPRVKSALQSPRAAGPISSLRPSLPTGEAMARVWTGRPRHGRSRPRCLAGWYLHSLSPPLDTSVLLSKPPPTPALSLLLLQTSLGRDLKYCLGLGTGCFGQAFHVLISILCSLSNPDMTSRLVLVLAPAECC